jgi:protoporphyrinogen oxidase
MAGAQVKQGQLVTKVRIAQGRASGITTQDMRTRSTTEYPAEAVISSLPLPALVQMFDPSPPNEVLEAAKRLRYRNYLVVNVILSRSQVFPDQWIYVQSPEVRLARVQNYKNWSPAMVPDQRQTSLGLEYFASSDESFWGLPDAELIAWGMRDLEKTGLATSRDLVDAFVVRQKNAYPIYEDGYRQHLDVVRSYIQGIPNLLTTGRAGLFRYCNSDLALRTGLLAARHLLGQPAEDLWSVQ